MYREIILKKLESEKEPVPFFLKDIVRESVQNFLVALSDRPLINLHEQFLEEVESPLLSEVMQHVKHNQSKAAILLGISRGTLRKTGLSHFD